MRKWLLKTALKFLVALVVVAVVGAAYLFYRAMPAYSGAVALPGLSAETRVWRDGYGAPHIFAANLDDAARALGYLHASERLYQMEINRRVGQGRVSEIAGADLVGVDRFIRTLGLYRLAQESYEALSPWAQQRLKAYADGVNAFLDSHRNALPPEFLILGDKPEPWKPADLLVVGQADGVAAQQQLFARKPARAAGAEAARRQGGVAVPDAEGRLAGHHGARRSPRSRQPDDREHRLGALLQMSHGASNEWVVAGARSDTGKPILANDPHLGSARRPLVSRARRHARRSRSRAPPSPACRSSCSARTTASPGASRRPTPTRGPVRRDRRSE